MAFTRVPGESVKDRYMHGRGADAKGQELPPRAALEAGWKEKCRLQGPLFSA